MYAEALNATAIIVGAGASSRMGSPKMALKYRGRSFLEHIVATLRVAAIDRGIVVIRRGDDKIINRKLLRGFALMESALPLDVGPIGSIRMAANEIINQTVDMCVIWPVDHPAANASTVTKLLQAISGSPDSIAVPACDGRRGHPIAVGRNVIPELTDPDVESLKSVVRRSPDRVVIVPVDDIGVTLDIDTPEDYAFLISSTNSLP